MVVLQAYHKKHSRNPLQKVVPTDPTSSVTPLLNYMLPCSEDQLVGELALRQTETCPEVLGKVLSLLDRGNDGRVDSLLVSSLGLRERLLSLRLALREELLLCGGLALGGSLGEV